MTKKTNWTPLEHKIHKEFLGYPLKNMFLWLLYSSGADSNGLLKILLQLSRAHGYQVGLIHFHHGGQSKYRQKASQMAQKIAKKFNLKLVQFKSKVELTQEDQMRVFRRSTLETFLKEQLNPNQNLFVLAHHQDDLTETRIFRLIRGVGTQGFKAMSVWSPPWFRPLLSLSKKELVNNSDSFKSYVITDPSNKNLNYFRNWIRHQWLPQLNDYYPGGVSRLGESLETIFEILEQNKKDHKMKWQIERLDRGNRVLQARLRLALIDFDFMTRPDKQRHLVFVFSHFKKKNYQKSQILELLNQLQECSSAPFSRDIGQINWTIDGPWLYATDSAGY